MAEKRNIFLIGPMGAGKSTIGRHLAEELHLEFFDSDQEIERRSGADIAWIFDLEGEEGFRLREENIINDLTDKQGICKPPLINKSLEPSVTSVVHCYKRMILKQYCEI
jgi:shikimate kinase